LISVRWEKIVVVLRVVMKENANLPKVVHAVHRLALRFGARERWQQHARQDCNNRDDHQQFDQCESFFRPRTRNEEHLHISAERRAYAQFFLCGAWIPVRGGNLKDNFDCTGDDFWGHKSAVANYFQRR
jgi:hypothetical protein